MLLAATISATRWSTSVPVITVSLMIAVGLRILGSSLPKICTFAGIRSPVASGTSLSGTVCAPTPAASASTAVVIARRVIRAANLLFVITSLSRATRGEHRVRLPVPA